MRRTPYVFLGILLVSAILHGTGAAAQSQCETVRTEQGEGGYQTCLRNEREQRSKQLSDIYRLQIESQKEKRTFFFDQRKRQSELLWKEADFDIELQIDRAEEQISRLRMSSSPEEEIRRELATIEALRQRQTLQTHYKEQFLKLYGEREKMERMYLDVQFARYELLVRGLPVLSYGW